MAVGRGGRCRARAAAVALALGAVLAAAGCGGAGSPRAAAPSSPAGSAIPTPAVSGTPATAPGSRVGAIPAVPGAPERPTGRIEEATLVRVVDGDTIRVVVGGTEERVRYIGMDTPEPNPRGDATPEPYAAAATAENSRLLGAAGHLVLERDVSDRDRFGRLLRHAWVDGEDGWVLVGLALVAGGCACVSTYPPDVRYADALVAVERSARAAGRGLWASLP